MDAPRGQKERRPRSCLIGLAALAIEVRKDLLVRQVHRFGMMRLALLWRDCK